MARAPRTDLPGLTHHVFNRGANRQTVFFADRDRIEFGSLLAEVHEMYGVEVLAYCLMGNHFHLVVRCPDGHLADSMQRLGSLYTRRLNDRLGRDGALFRGRYGSIVIDTTGYLLTAVRYVHRNSLDIAGVEQPGGYRWSSHRTYLGLRPKPDFVRTDLVLEHFASVERFDEFVAGPADRRSRPVSCGEVRSVIELAIAECTIGLDVNDRPGLARVVATALLDHLPEPLAASLDHALGCPAARTRRRARQLSRDDPLVRAVLAIAAGELGYGKEVPGRSGGV